MPNLLFREQEVSGRSKEALRWFFASADDPNWWNELTVLDFHLFIIRVSKRKHIFYMVQLILYPLISFNRGETINDILFGDHYFKIISIHSNVYRYLLNMSPP